MHRRGNKPDPHQYPQAEHTAHHALLLLTGKLACHQRQRQNNKAAYDALAEDRKDHQRPFMPSVSHLTPPSGSRITSGIATRPGIGVRFDNDTRPGKVRRRQRRYRGQPAVLSAQFGNRPEIQRPQRAGLDADRLFPLGDALVTAIALGHMAFVGVVLWGAVRAGHMAVAAANAYLFVDHHKTVFALMHRAARTDLGAGRIFTVVTGDGEVIGKHVAARRRCPPASRRRHIHRCGGS